MPFFPRDLGRERSDGQQPLRHLTVGGEIVLPVQQVIVDPGDRRHIRIKVSHDGHARGWRTAVALARDMEKTALARLTSHTLPGWVSPRWLELRSWLASSPLGVDAVPGRYLDVPVAPGSADDHPPQRDVVRGRRLVQDVSWVGHHLD